MAARLAPVVAEMTDVGRLVEVGRAAADAVLRVGGVLQCRPSVPRIVQPEAQRSRRPFGEIGNHGVVGVDDERRAVGERGSHLSPAFGDELELPVAIELVPEEVREQ